MSGLVYECLPGQMQRGMQDNHTASSGAQSNTEISPEAEGNAPDHVRIVRDPDARNPEGNSAGVPITTSDGREGVWRLIQSGAGAAGLEERAGEDNDDHDGTESEHGSQHTGNGSRCLSRESSPIAATDPFSDACSLAGDGEKACETKKPSSPVGDMIQEPRIDMEGCIATMRAFVRGAEPGIRRLRLVIGNVFTAHGVIDPSMQSDAIREMQLTPIEVEMCMSFMLTEGELSPVWRKPVHARGDDAEVGCGGRWGGAAGPKPKKIKRQLARGDVQEDAEEEVWPLSTRLSRPSMQTVLIPPPLPPPGQHVMIQSSRLRAEPRA